MRFLVCLSLIYSNRLMTDILSNLNEHQCDAVLATEGRVRVVAGAGSGKTRVLAHRFAHLVNNLGVDPANILCMTFTNKAAAEMRGRISRLVAAGDANDFVCTIHGFCVKVLRRDIHRLGFPKTFTILDEDDNETIAKQVLAAHGLDRSKKTVNKLLQRVAAFKDFECPDYIGIYMLQDSPKFRDDSGFSDVESFIHYQAMNYALEFDDIINFTLFLLDNFPEVREYWQEKLNYIMVDEVQDCNEDDWKIMRIISGRYDNLFIVGDPDQAIYEWRGARPSMFVDWKPDTDIVLARNYRSTPDVLDVANSIISNNTRRIPKTLFTPSPRGLRPLHFHAKNDAAEAKWIADRIFRIHKNGTPYSDIAVLFRASFMSRAIEQVLIHKKIPYTIWGTVRFFDRKEIKDALAYLRLVAIGDNISFSRIINTPSRHFGEISMKRVREISNERRIPFYEALKENLDLWRKTKAYPQLCAFVWLIDKCRDMQKSAGISEILNFILKDTGLTESYRDDQKEERLENIEELLHSIRSYEHTHRNDDVTLSSYLQDVALMTNADYKDDSSMVKLMTIHQAKGLEFPCVFICGLSEGAFPSHRTLRERRLAGLEEERRLMYVAVTRAGNQLFLTEAEGYNIQTRADKFPSRFLAEIGEGMLDREGKIDDAIWDGTRQLVGSINAEIGLGSVPPKIMDTPAPEDRLQPGDKVIHKFFGCGIVLSVAPDGMRVKVRFGDDEKSDRHLLASLLVRQ